MNEKLNGRVPLLGQKAHIGAQVGALARVLNKDGLMEVGVIQGPQGPVPAVTRDMFYDAEELLDEIRTIIRAEIRECFKDLRQKGFLSGGD